MNTKTLKISIIFESDANFQITETPSEINAGLQRCD